MPEVRYLLRDDAQVLALGRELVALGFNENAEADWDDPQSIRDMLSDIEWYSERWVCCTVPYRKEMGFHPVAGPEGEWDTYMWSHTDWIWLVQAAP